MKIQFYYSPAMPNTTIRCKDGVYTLLDDKDNPVIAHGDYLGAEEQGKYYVDDPGRECDQAWAANLTKMGLLYDNGSDGAKVHNWLMYGIPKDAEIYPRE